ncbi:MAG: peptide-methionine (S)-S-oxide reductase MsrA [Gammaproteobacteria bacterium]|nr:peptide-methionine (S)-S-oxide reductase MsrA [Gammaproteobacteria bacterium]
MSFLFRTRLPSKNEALVGRDAVRFLKEPHAVFGRSFTDAIAENHSIARFAMGCFWGAERLFWQVDGVYLTWVGYSGGFTKNPTYQEVCSGRTGHAETVQVIYDSSQVSYAELLEVFWKNHDPSQGMRQGHDVGTQYRSCIFFADDEQKKRAVTSMNHWQSVMRAQGLGDITTELLAQSEFYLAEEFHQQYLAKNPGAVCSIASPLKHCRSDDMVVMS